MNVSIDILEGSARTDLESVSPGSPGADLEGERTLLGIRQARDLVLGKNRELIDKLARAEDEIAELTYQRDDFMVARDVALRKAAELAAEAAGLCSKVAQLTDQQAALAEVEKIYVLARAEIEADLVTLAEERDAAVEATRAQAREIERLRADLATARAELANARPASAPTEETDRQLAAAQEAHERYAAQQRKSVAGLAEQLAAAQRARDESRRQATQLLAERDALRERTAQEKGALEARLAALEAQRETVPTRPVLPPPEIADATPFSDKEIRDSIGSLHLHLEAWKAQAGNAERLAVLEAALHAFAERTAGGGLDLLHYMTSAASDFARRLRATPARIAAAAAIFESAIEMLGWLGLRGRAEMLDLNGALIYAVDDDVDNCECLASAFEKVGLQTKYSVRPEVALEQIAAHPCELIVLDVDLPGMDGFALHARLRQMPAHAATPIIFLSGHVSTRERLKALAGDHNQFVAKPYNLSELSLRVLTLIVEARLG